MNLYVPTYPLNEDRYVAIMRVRMNKDCNVISNHGILGFNENNETGTIHADDGDEYYILNELRIKNVNRILSGYLNINSLRYTFDMLSDIIVGKIDILLIPKIKLDS